MKHAHYPLGKFITKLFSVEVSPEIKVVVDNVISAKLKEYTLESFTNCALSAVPVVSIVAVFGIPLAVATPSSPLLVAVKVVIVCEASTVVPSRISSTAPAKSVLRSCALFRVAAAFAVAIVRYLIISLLLPVAAYK